MTNDEMQQRLGRLTPRGVRMELRGQVLGAVASRLQRELPSGWLRRAAMVTAASILLGVVLNVWANWAADRQMVRLLGLPPPRQMATSPAEYYAAVNRIIREMQGFPEGFRDETHQEDTEMDRRSPRRAGGGGTGCQRLAGLDYRYTA